jgi:hypothetical protein
MSVDLSRTHRGATFAFALFLAALAAVAACQDVSELLTLREEVRQQLGYERIEVGVRYPESRVVMTLQDPGSEAASPDRETARTAAALARRAYARTRDSDSIEVVFEETRDDGGLVSTVTRRSFTFATSALSEEPD